MITDRKTFFSYGNLARELAQARRGKKVVLATGSFDVFHPGHLLFLDYAKRQGDILVVGVATDITIKEVKGFKRPIIPEKLRVRFVAGLEVVDFAVLCKEKLIDGIDMQELIHKIRPDVLVVTYKDRNMPGVERLADFYNVKLIKAPRIRPGKVNFPLSTTYILDRLA